MFKTQLFDTKFKTLLTMSSVQKQNINHLMFGYTKSNHHEEIPVEIIAIIEQFYDEYFYWKLQKDEISQFFNTKNGQRIHCPTTFTIKNVDFECTLFPNGGESRSKGVRNN